MGRFLVDLNSQVEGEKFFAYRAWDAHLNREVILLQVGNFFVSPWPEEIDQFQNNIFPGYDTSVDEPANLLELGNFLIRRELTLEGQYPAWDWNSPEQEELFKRFGKYYMGRRLGTGSMGVVQFALDPDPVGSNFSVAIKYVLPFVLQRDPSLAERFEEEIRTMSQIRHPNVLHVYASGSQPSASESEPSLYYVMPFVDGITLKELFGREYEPGRSVQPGQAMEIGIQIADGLHTVHEQGVVHRDLKPANVFLEGKSEEVEGETEAGEPTTWIKTWGEIKIADFGLAHDDKVVRNSRMTTTGQVIGTPDYMSPEQYGNPSNVDGRADVYSLGVILYRFATGRLPFIGMNVETLLNAAV